MHTKICKIVTLISEDEILLTIMFIENDHYVLYIVLKSLQHLLWPELH